MKQHEFCNQLHRCNKYRDLDGQLKKVERAIEDLKVSEGTLEMSIGSPAHQCFQVFRREELNGSREALANIFCAERDRIKIEIETI